MRYLIDRGVALIVRYFNRRRRVVTGEEIIDSSPVAVADAIDIRDK